MLKGVDNDPHQRAIAVVTAEATKGATVFAPERIRDPDARKQATRFMRGWRMMRALLDLPQAAEAKAAVKALGMP